ncbi:MULTISPECIES: MinD/ParA family protein [unclassified Streptomyces]|uniref:MinD/ParA family ATP-binding protein n=1 Tax=unclassified Streptomyces TaxID=2593676 RepID=UPI00381663E5
MVTAVARNDLDAPEHWTDAPDHSPEHWRTGRSEAPPGTPGAMPVETPAETPDGVPPERAAEAVPAGHAPMEPSATEPAPASASASASASAEPVAADPAPMGPVPAEPVSAVAPERGPEHPPETEAGSGTGAGVVVRAAVPLGSVPARAAEPLTEVRPARRASRPLFRIGRRGGPGGAPDVLRVPLLRSHRIAVIGLSGGAGKTTTALALGAVLARERADRVVAVDASPDSGALGRRVRRQSDATVRDLVAALPGLRTYMDIRAFTSQTPSGLEVVAHDPDPADLRAFGERDYRQVVGLLSGQYPIVVTDSGTGMPHAFLRAVLELSDQLVVAAAPGADGMSGAGLVFDRLTALGHEEKARQAVTVVSAGRSSPGRPVRMDEAVAHFQQRCRAVVTVPYDPQLARGGEVDPESMRSRTRAAYYELAALVAGNFPRD